MFSEQLPNIILWGFLWISSWGIFLYLHKRFENIYIRYFVLTSLYFLSVTAITILVFGEYVLSVFSGFTPVPFIVLGGAILLHIVLYFYFPKKITAPEGYFKKYPARQYLQINWRRLISKSADILSQQLFILLLVIFLQKAGLTFYQVIISFAVIFGLVHMPLILLERGAWPAWYFTAFSILSAIIFPALILKIQYGFVYSYLVHWLFYTFIAVGFWIIYPIYLKGRNY